MPGVSPDTVESGLVEPVREPDGPRDQVGPPEDTEEPGVDGSVPGERRVDTVEPLRKKDIACTSQSL